MFSSSHGRGDLLPVVVGGDLGAYAICREFNEAWGVNCIAVCTGFIGSITHSRIITTRTVPQLTRQPLLAAIRRIADEHPDAAVVLIANTDALIELLEQIVDDLPRNVICPIPPRKAFDTVCDKDAFSRLCNEHGLDTPRTEVVHLSGDDPVPPSDLPFPVVGKPAVSAEYAHLLPRGFKKVYFMTEQSQLDGLWHDLRDAGFAGDFLVQELIGGDDTYMDSLTMYIGRDGTPLMLGAAQVLLEDHAPSMLGNPVAMVIRDKPELWRKAGALLADVGYRGFVNFDIKRDPNTGRELFLDCNPRIGRNSYYNVAGGVNPMEVMVRDAVDGETFETRIADEPALYTVVPVRLLRRYVRDASLIAELNELVAKRRVFDPQRYDQDRAFRRRLDVMLTETNQFRKFRQYYPEPTDTSF